MILAILRAQLLSMRSFRLVSSRRGAVFSLLIALIWYGAWALAALGAYGFAAGADSRLLEAYLPVGFLLVFLYWQLAPLVSASMGASLDLRKLLVYPVPHRKLFLVEVLLRLTTCSEALLVMAGGVAGLLRNPVFGGWASAPRILAAAAIFVGFNLLLAAGLRNVIERLLARKRVREIVVLLFVLAMGAPRLIMASRVRFEKFQPLLAAAERLFWPWSAVAAASLGQNVAGAFPMLAGWTLAAYFFGRWQFERSLRFDAQAAQATILEPARARAGLGEKLFRLPGLLLPDPLGAIVEKEMRSLSRTPRFRLVFVMGFTFGLLVWLPIIVGRRGRPGVMQDNFLVLVSVYALTLLGQVSYWNAFGFDRSAAQVYFSVPVPVSQALAGKNLAAAFFILVELALVTVACLLLRVAIPPLKILEAFVVTPVAAVYLLALGNLSSVHFPRALNPERTGQGGSANRFQGLLFLLYPFALLPIFLAYVARYALASQWAFWGVLAFAAALGAAFYWIAMESAVATALDRREMILAELARGGDGPVAAE